MSSNFLFGECIDFDQLFLNTIPLSFEDANSECGKENGRLAEPIDRQFFERMQAFYRDKRLSSDSSLDNCWIGLRDIGTNGEERSNPGRFVLLDGSLNAFTSNTAGVDPWQANEPNGGLGLCVNMFRNTLLLDDTSCDNRRVSLCTRSCNDAQITSTPTISDPLLPQDKDKDNGSILDEGGIVMTLGVGAVFCCVILVFVIIILLQRAKRRVTRDRKRKRKIAENKTDISKLNLTFSIPSNRPIANKRVERKPKETKKKLQRPDSKYIKETVAKRESIRSIFAPSTAFLRKASTTVEEMLDDDDNTEIEV